MRTRQTCSEEAVLAQCAHSTFYQFCEVSQTCRLLNSTPCLLSLCQVPLRSALHIGCSHACPYGLIHVLQEVFSGLPDGLRAADDWQNNTVAPVQCTAQCPTAPCVTLAGYARLFPWHVPASLASFWGCGLVMSADATQQPPVNEAETFASLNLLFGEATDGKPSTGSAVFCNIHEPERPKTTLL